MAPGTFARIVVEVVRPAFELLVPSFEGVPSRFRRYVSFQRRFCPPEAGVARCFGMFAAFFFLKSQVKSVRGRDSLTVSAFADTSR